MALSSLRKWILRKYLNGLFRDAQKGEYGMNVKGLLDWLNGRKQAIGLLLTFLSVAAEQIPAIVEAFGGDSLAVTKALGVVVVIVGAIHKVVKGS
jgi:hypothetical protein